MHKSIFTCLLLIIVTLNSCTDPYNTSEVSLEIFNESGISGSAEFFITGHEDNTFVVDLDVDETASVTWSPEFEGGDGSYSVRFNKMERNFGYFTNNASLEDDPIEVIFLADSIIINY
jgi:hypothetical protein